jgi:hypothetical protein
MLLVGVADHLGEKLRARLRADIERIDGCIDSEDGSFVAFKLLDYQRPAYGGHHSFEFEGRLEDTSGLAITALVNADENGRLLEIEFLNWGGIGPIEPNWSKLEFVPSPPLSDR